MSYKNQIVTNQELLVSNLLEIQAVIRILKRKGITTEDELLEEAKKLKVEMDEMIKKNEQGELISQNRRSIYEWIRFRKII